MKQLYCVVILLLCAMPCFATWPPDQNGCAGLSYNYPVDWTMYLTYETGFSYQELAIDISNCAGTEGDDFYVYINIDSYSVTGSCVDEESALYTCVQNNEFSNPLSVVGCSKWRVAATGEHKCLSACEDIEYAIYCNGDTDKIYLYFGGFVYADCTEYVISAHVNNVRVEKISGSTCTSTSTPTGTSTSTPTGTAANTNTPTSTHSPTPLPPTSTYTPTSTDTPTSSSTFTNTNTATDTPSSTNTPTRTNTPTSTKTPTIDLPEAMDATPYVWSTSGDALFAPRHSSIAYYGGDYALGTQMNYGETSNLAVVVPAQGRVSVWVKENAALDGENYINLYIDDAFVISSAAVTTWQNLQGNAIGSGTHLVELRHTTNEDQSGVAYADYFTYSTFTPTSTPSITNTHTNTPTHTRTNTPSNTATATNTQADTFTATETPTVTDTTIDTPTSTNTPPAGSTATNTPTITNTPTRTHTHTSTATNTVTDTPTATDIYADTPTATNTPTYTVTSTMLHGNTNPRLLGNTTGKPDVANDIEQPTLTSDIVVFTRNYLVGKILILFNR